MGRALAAVAMGSAMAGVGLVAPAGAQEAPPPEVRFVASVVVVNPTVPDRAKVIGVYRCFGGQPIHLWVSVKQNGEDLEGEGSGGRAASWYDTNVVDVAPVNCDGRYHSAVVTVGQHPDKDALSNGPAWVQFCLVAPDPEHPDAEFGIIASQSQWDTVVGAFHLG